MTTKRGTSLTAIKTRAGVSVVRVEHRPVAGRPVRVAIDAPAQPAGGKLRPIAAEVARMLRDRPVAFPQALM